MTSVKKKEVKYETEVEKKIVVRWPNLSRLKIRN